MRRGGVRRGVSISVALLPGSTRSGSLNTRLAGVVADELRARGVDADQIDLADYPMDLYDADAEAARGQPQAARDLHDRLQGHDGLIIVSPEYNGGPPPLLKNALDWVSRIDRGVLSPMLHGIAAATPGRRGGQTVIAVWKLLYDHMGLDAHPGKISLGAADDAFGPAGLARPADAELVGAYLDGYVATLRSRAQASAA